MKQLKWGFIGCGEVTEKKSGPAFSEVEGSSVEAVMSRSEQRARTYAITHGIRKWYTDAQEIIDDPDVNAIYVATPPSSHATYAIMAMKAGKPVYVEKPLAASYEDCARINRISEQTGIPCFVAYYRRYLPYFQKVKEIVTSGRIGKILNVQIRYTEPLRAADAEAIKNGTPLAWRLQPEIAGGGYFYDMAPHQLDLLHLLEIRQIAAVISHETRDACLFGDTVDTGTVFITGRQRLLNIHRFSCFHGHNGIGSMTRRRRGHIDGIHIRIIDDLLSISVPLTDAVRDSISACPLL